MSYFIRGPVNDEFYMVGVDDQKTSYVYGYQNNNIDTLGFYLSDNFLQSTSIVPAKMTYQNDFLKVKGNNLIESSDGITTSVQTNQKLTFSPIHEEVKGLYAGPFYTLKGKEPITFPIVSNTEKIPDQIKNIRVVPVNYFKSNNCVKSDSFLDEISWIKDPINFKFRGFTTKQECSAGKFYSYCTKKCEKDCVGSCDKKIDSHVPFNFNYLFFLPIFVLFVIVIFVIFSGEKYLVFN